MCFRKPPKVICTARDGGAIMRNPESRKATEGRWRSKNSKTKGRGPKLWGLTFLGVTSPFCLQSKKQHPRRSTPLSCAGRDAHHRFYHITHNLPKKMSSVSSFPQANDTKYIQVPIFFPRKGNKREERSPVGVVKSLLIDPRMLIYPAALWRWR